MEPRELYPVFLKGLGVAIVVASLSMLANANDKNLHYNNEVEFFYIMMAYFVPPGIGIICGCLLFLATDWFVRLTFPASFVADDVEIKNDKSRGLFAAILKIVGIWTVVPGLGGLAYAVYEVRKYDAGKYKIAWWLECYGTPAIAFAAGLLLLLATDWFVARLTYREQEANGSNAYLKRRQGRC